MKGHFVQTSVCQVDCVPWVDKEYKVVSKFVASWSIFFGRCILAQVQTDPLQGLTEKRAKELESALGVSCQAEFRSFSKSSSGMLMCVCLLPCE